jgi:hypothetical protein
VFLFEVLMTPLGRCAVGFLCLLCGVISGCQRADAPPAPGGAATATGAPGASGAPGAPGAPANPGSVTQPVAGKIMGVPFRPDQVNLARTNNGLELGFRTGTDFFADQEIKFGLRFNPGTPPSAPLAGQSFSVANEFASPFVHLSQKKPGSTLPSTDMVSGSDYTLKVNLLEQSGHQIKGTVDLQVKQPPDTHLVGTFTATYEPSAEEPPTAADAPYVTGTIAITGDKADKSCSANVFGLAQGKRISNSAGLPLKDGEAGWIISSTFKPQLTSLGQDATGTVRYKHTVLPPGEYVVGAGWRGVLATWKPVTIEPGSELTVDLAIDPTHFGRLIIELAEGTPELETGGLASGIFRLVPANTGISFAFDPDVFRVEFEAPPEESATLPAVPPGKYLVRWGRYETEVEIAPDAETKLILGGKP